MRIIGISGLENSVPFKKLAFAGRDEREYRIVQGMDAAAALVIDGKLIVAAEQERFNREKATGKFPVDAIQFCLDEAGLKIEDIDEIAHGFNYAPYAPLYAQDPISADLYAKVFSREALTKQLQRNLPTFPLERLKLVNHHLAHAASAAYTSGWEECLVVVNDAMGETESLSVFDFHDGEFERIASVGANDSIGVLYSLVTMHLGFDFNSDEYKIMGLAPYGDPTKYRGFFERVVELREDGTFRIPILKINHSREEREFYLATREYLDEHLIERRLPNQPVTKMHEDIAASLQECLERVIIHVCEHFGEKTGLRHLALAGGVALNCTANGKLMRSGLFDEIYVQPVAGDDGVALGAALVRSAAAGEVCNHRMPPPLLGPRSDDAEIEAALAQFSDCVEWKKFTTREETCTMAGQLIGEGHVIAWHRGRMEYGPRALGNRSILADPGHPEMRDRINAMVKKREAFRPFAPACSLEEASRYFEIAENETYPYMISIVNVRPEMRAQLPAITHVNGSARLQTVSMHDNPDFHALLVAVGKSTGRQMVLNTSFNVKGQPIVNTPSQAIETFLGTEIEYLFVENYYVRRIAL